HSPTNKVLYARDVSHYKEEVKAYYQQIADMGAVTKEEMEIFLTEESKKHENEFKEWSAMVELGKYVQRYSVQSSYKLDYYLLMVQPHINVNVIFQHVAEA
ncbi:hypothetical protein scyTo_0016961, partial [Scyliorhinus torazame]|nr:hypothetical protein [Scyliorhinus torazame]